MPDIRLHSGLTLLEAHQVAQQPGMHLIDNGRGDVKVSPIVPEGWNKIALRVKVTSPTSGRVCTDAREAA